jgi:DNA-directed RNA polymerase specialized sigma24 family protein
VVRQLNVFRRPESRPGLRSWLYSLVRAKAIDLLRTRHRRREAALEGA